MARWLVADSARVEGGDDVLEIESDKMVQTITAPAGGIVRQVVAVRYRPVHACSEPARVSYSGCREHRARPWVSGDLICARPTVHLALRWDNRVVDGEEAATLVGRIAELVQDYDYLTSLDETQMC